MYIQVAFFAVGFVFLLLFQNSCLVFFAFVFSFLQTEFLFRIRFRFLLFFLNP